MSVFSTTSLITKTTRPNFTEYFVHAAYKPDSVSVRQRCNVLSASAFADGVMS